MIKKIVFFVLIASVALSCRAMDFFSEFQVLETTDEVEQDLSQFQDIEGISCIPDIDSYEEALVVRVIDGDSIEVNLYGEVVEVRYIGINTPEYYSNDQEKAVEATQANQRLVSGEYVYLFKDISDTDKYGRFLRYVLTDEVFVNLELVSQGFAQAKEYHPDTACHQVFQMTGE